MGKLSLIAGCSIIPGFDGSVGSVSSLQSLYSQVLYRAYLYCSGLMGLAEFSQCLCVYQPKREILELYFLAGPE